MSLCHANSTIGLLLSGGLDSSILLGHLVRHGRTVQPFLVRFGLIWEREEGRAAKRFIRALRSPRIEPLVVLRQPAADLYGEHWSTTGRGTPGIGSSDEAVYLPGRNALLLLKPALWCQLHGIRELALGVLGGNPFADATHRFFEQYESALSVATGTKVCISRPFAVMSKSEVLQLGRDMPLQHTYSCIAPVDGRHCGRCNKCEERRSAFRTAGIADPTCYGPPVEPS